MKKLLAICYHFLSWLILLVLFLSFLVFYILEVPAPFFKLLAHPLKTQGISYGKIEGSLLSDFVIHDLNYQNQIKAKSLGVKIDLEQLENKVLYVDTLLLDEVQIDEDFLTSLIELHSTDEKAQEVNTSLPFEHVILNHLSISLRDTRYEKYHVNYAKLTLLNVESDMKKSHKAEVKFYLDSNVSQIKLEGKFKDEAFNCLGTIEGEQLFLKPFLHEYNATLLSNPRLKINADGNLDNIDFKVSSEALDLQYQHYKFYTEVFSAIGNYNAVKNILKVKLENSTESNIAQFGMNADVNVKLDDINNTLKFKFNTELNPKEKLLKEALLIAVLAEHNMSIDGLPEVKIMAKGDMNKVTFDSNIKNFKATQNDLSLALETLKLKGDTQPLKGDTVLNTSVKFDSSVSQGEVFLVTKLNFYDVKNTLDFELKSTLEVYKNYLNPLLKEHNITLEKDTLLNLKSSGNMNRLKVNFDVLSSILKEDIASTVRLKTDNILLDLKKEFIQGALSLESDASNLALNINSQFSGNYARPKELVSNSTVNIRKFDAFSIHLTPLLPLNLNINTNEQGAKVNLTSKKLQLLAHSADYDGINFSLKSEKIYPAQLLVLPPELKKQFIALDLEGEVTLSKKYFSLKGLLNSNKNFEAKLNASLDVNGLDVNVLTKHLQVLAKGDLESKKIDTFIKIDSLKKFQKEFQALYPFEIVPVEGAVEVEAKLDGEQVKAILLSEKLALEGFNIEGLTLDAEYDNELITMNTFNFKTTGFKEQGLNQSFYLNQKALVHLGAEKKVLLDMHPKILLKGSGDNKNLKASFQIEDLFLGYPQYGKTRLNCDLKYVQTGKKKKLTGVVFLDKMRIFYESKFLDPSSDNDVVILRKKDKKQKEIGDTFLNDTFIDLAIYAVEANYKTRDIDLLLDVNLKAHKEFGKNLVMLGKVEEIDGRVEQAPKLFTVVDSNIVFQGGKEINPLLDLTVEHELPDVLITINIYGNAKRPKLTFTSEPPLPKKDILSYLLLGVSTASLGEGKGSLGREAQLFIMNQAARDLAYEVELDRVFVKDDGTGDGYAVQVGKKVQEDSMFVIENSKEGNSFILEYDVSKNIKIEVGQHQKTVPSQSVDIYFRKKFK
ncbi:MAG: Unknown protein [uncultured Sulfurovum sp.]|uniref:Translocation and assembly module TamB C-terminal domain-containing protein n=1 Tax=uncultured Sulfurovum sp. TaxID=269237 RepID=A0A6S6U2T5_9BACT|nr:MAG: Unknown protein [uncultured Sulfurovum sp.]